jgi:uncharacterized membrane protein YkvA (DUF1232 family)
MDDFWSFMTVTVICVSVVLCLFFVLVSFKSRFSVFALKVYSMTLETIAVISIIYVLSPMDLLPDLIPILGQIDDAAALVQALFTGVMGAFSWLESNKMKRELAPEIGERFLPRDGSSG